ncbi:hypothetical protein JTB14_031116 [Gonioctena quinquepunctata]|nr:hypothetical protein JTB14_031116 [Gonioctena quinquepunctata]
MYVIAIFLVPPDKVCSRQFDLTFVNLGVTYCQIIWLKKHMQTEKKKKIDFILSENVVKGATDGATTRRSIARPTSDFFFASTGLIPRLSSVRGCFLLGKMKWLAVFVLTIVVISLAVADGEVWEEDDHEVLIRSERGAKNREECRYGKGAWSECDPKTNQRSRTLTLKKGNQTSCEPTKTIQKKCKKACRYEKGAWAECNAQSQMTRSDKLKPNSDASCEQTRQITKKCKAKGAKPTKGKKGPRRNRQ